MTPLAGPADDRTSGAVSATALPAVAVLPDPAAGSPQPRTVAADLDGVEAALATLDPFGGSHARNTAATAIASAAQAAALAAPATAIPAAQSPVQEYFRTRTARLDGDAAAAACLRIISGAWMDLADAPVSGADLTRLVAATQGVVSLLDGPRAAATPDEGVRADSFGTHTHVWATRWIVAHQVHSMLAVYATLQIDEARSRIALTEHGGAAVALNRAAELVRGFPAARAHALAVPTSFYEEVLRPSMLPPLTVVPLSGRMHTEYRAFRESLGRLLEDVPLSAAELAANDPVLALARDALLEADLIDAERHVTAVEAVVGSDRSLIQAPRSHENAVSMLRRIRAERTAWAAPYLRFTGQPTAAPGTSGA